jgi:hypothetical protein
MFIAVNMEQVLPKLPQRNAHQLAGKVISDDGKAVLVKCIAGKIEGQTYVDEGQNKKQYTSIVTLRRC